MSVKEDVCAVCYGARSSRKDQIIYCDGDGCDIPVHQSCYGVEVIPEGDWFCQRCEDGIPVDKTRIICCSSQEGALKRTIFRNSYMHVVCAMWNKEIPRKVEPYTFNLSKTNTHSMDVITGIIHLNGILETKPVAFCKDHRKVLVIEDISDDENALQNFIDNSSASIKMEDFKNPAGTSRPREGSSETSQNKRLRGISESKNGNGNSGTFYSPSSPSSPSSSNLSSPYSPSSEISHRARESSEMPLFETLPAAIPLNKFHGKHSLASIKHKSQKHGGVLSNVSQTESSRANAAGPPHIIVTIPKPKQSKGKQRETTTHNRKTATSTVSTSAPAFAPNSNHTHNNNVPVPSEPVTTTITNSSSSSIDPEKRHKVPPYLPSTDQTKATKHSEPTLDPQHTKQHTTEEYRRLVSQLKAARQEVYNLRKFRKTTAQVFSKLNVPPAGGVSPSEDTIERYMTELNGVLERTRGVTDYERAKLEHQVDMMLTRH
ncbi:hypothetical protein PHYBLDRAFT_152149 [Phycomyces blakesleeanus NRRL 1555(-)]|uniref:PHD-type domain-containing protein n=1 Tax=Phycomyces blakesleeanus (strain ATCC 8743b / DSM 1359 / FGSC 10004 / NBRC 33097 / NRRL 1555) TaxID=763407 RepID=A0A162N8P3_PHYB8|nr:hypothetical protein PHYBLDRAFT_152149 [Phycomyces blakesleeanus NRRL 1555(-)]OAD66884.1 hypothetical protein PHYBLDRAFT_152149 [Phycomyces blakesleeanus NRRL 1555(-)]|eukprot:XP_018284924.1 hypothetical protein PHYBLDRAFT_152149 [Phycomyces blakesleeanus NRRL 1555(-)]